VLSLLYEGGTVQSEMLESDEADERRSAKQQIRQLKALISKYA
jgi:hypothetical protein